MRTLARPLWLFVVGATLALVPQTGWAQGRAQPETEKVKTSGTIKEVRNGLLHIVTESGDQYLVKPPAKPQDIVFNGSADPSWLKRGMWVQFAGRFDAKGQPVAPVSQVLVFSPRPEYKLGVERESGSNSALKNLFSEEKPSDQPKVESASYLVTGRLTGIKSSALSVTAGRTPVKVELAENARVSLDLADLSLVREGDKVSIDGWNYPAKKQEIYATKITVTAAEPIGKKSLPDKDEDENKREQ